jgi:hypothetical protein
VRTILLVVIAALSCSGACAESDEVLLAKMQRTVSLFECGNLVDTKEERHPFLDAGMKSGREFLAALNGDRGLYARIMSKVDFVFFYDSPTIDFQLGAAYAALGERVSKPFENTKSIDQLRIARARAFADKNCALIVK